MPVFNYTDSNNRQIFSTFVNETLTLNKLFSLIKTIDWTRFSFKGESEFDSLIWNEAKGESELVSIKKNVTATCNEKIPYYIFGGSVYSLLMTKFPDEYHYMDPTGDIDIILNVPDIVFDDGSSNGDYGSRLTTENSSRPNTLMR